MSSKKKLSRNAAVSDTKVFPQLCIINIINLEISNLYLTSYLKLQDITTLPRLSGGTRIASFMVFIACPFLMVLLNCRRPN